MSNPPVSVPLEYWAAFVAVAEEGTVNAAAERLGKSNSTVSYSLKQLQKILGAELFGTAGRGLVLTQAGQALQRRAQQLLRDAALTEDLARHYAAGWEAELRVAVDAVFPQDVLLTALETFARRCPHTRLQLLETTLSGTDEALFSGRVDMALSYRLPPGFVGEKLLDMRFMAVVGSAHALAGGRDLPLETLRNHRQMVVRDSGVKRNQDAGWLGSDQRWTVSHFEMSRALIKRNLGYGWLPLDRVREDLRRDSLQPLDVSEGKVREIPMYLIIARQDERGPALKALIEALRGAASDARLHSEPAMRVGPTAAAP